MRVLGLCSYPVESASTRFRMAQYVPLLREKGIELTVSPFLDSAKFREFYTNSEILKKGFGMLKPVFGRTRAVLGIRKYDLIFVQREAMLFGPEFFEWIYRKIGNLPMVLDLDDATYIPYVSPIYGRAGSFFKFFGKTDRLIERADLVVCGNPFIAKYVESKGAKTVVIPTVVDTGIFCPVETDNEVPIIGWIGTHSTFSFLETLFPVLERLAGIHRFKLKIVGSGKKDIQIEGVELENLKWNMERETADFQSLDIGLYPINVSGSASEQWIMGKSGFKAIQYLAVGVPFVMSPIGVCAEIGEANTTHFNAVSPEDWYNSLDRLLSDAKLRKEMGARGRKHSLDNYKVPMQAAILARALKSVCGFDEKE